MATFVTAHDIGPKSSHLASGGPPVVIVVLAEAGAEVILSFEDLDTLAEVIHLFEEAHAQLTTALIETRGQRRPVNTIGVGDRIVVDDDIVEVSTIVIHGDRFGISYDGGYIERPLDGTVTQIVPSLEVVPMMFSIALTDGTDRRLMFCGYQYVELPLPGEGYVEGRRDQGPALWVRTERKRGVWCGDFTGRRPAAFVSMEQASMFMDELAVSHPAFVGKLLIVNATTGEAIGKVDA